MLPFIPGRPTGIFLIEEIRSPGTHMGRRPGYNRATPVMRCDLNVIKLSEVGHLAAGQICDPMDDDGNVLISQQPGLGFELNWDYIDDNRV